MERLKLSALALIRDAVPGGAPGAVLAIRATARLSLLLLTGAMIAPRLPARLRRERPYLIGLALSHTLHGLAIATLAAYTNGANLAVRSDLDIGAGAAAYLAVVILVGWRAAPRSIVTLVLFYVWSIFFLSYLGRALDAPATYGFALVPLAVGAFVRASIVLESRRGPCR